MDDHRISQRRASPDSVPALREHLPLKENPAPDSEKCLVFPHRCQASSSQGQLASCLRTRGFPEGGEKRAAALLHAVAAKLKVTPLGNGPIALGLLPPLCPRCAPPAIRAAWLLQQPRECQNDRFFSLFFLPETSL